MRPPIVAQPAEILQTLIRFDTTNPPGNERGCVEYMQTLLDEAGIETHLFAKTPFRPNLVARLKGTGNAPPILLYGHTDVVSTNGQHWTHPPFDAQNIDGVIWGRGALDMKHGLAMYIYALLKARAENLSLPGDIIFAATVDEEVRSEFGAVYLVEEHPELFKDVRYALSEFGGASLEMAGKRFYLIQTSEKMACPVRLTFRGPGGHGAVPVRGGAMSKLADALRILDRHQLPVHVTPPTREMLEALAAGMGGLQGMVLRQLLNPPVTDLVLKLIGSIGSTFAPLLHNSVSPTILKASDKINILPTEVSLDLDGRVLPGFSATDLESELRALLGEDCTIDSHLPYPGPAKADLSRFEILAETLRQLDPQGIPVPFINYATTDARFFSRLGIQTYGFTPLRISEGLSLTGTIHGADERVPIAALEFGAQAVYMAIQHLG